jgi:hypothetical protein
MDVIQLLVAETDKYYLDTLGNDDGSSKLSDVTVQEMNVFLALIIQMGYGKWDTLKDYWSTLEHFCRTFYSNMMKCDRFFFNILRFLHFCDNMNQPDKTDNNYDRLWKIISFCDMLSDSYAKLYNPSEHLTVD